MNETIISLNELHSIKVNDKEIETLPVTIDSKIYLRKASSFLIQGICLVQTVVCLEWRVRFLFSTNT